MVKHRAKIVHLCLTLLLALPIACTNKEQRAADMTTQAQLLLDSGQPEPASAMIAQAIRSRDDLPGPYLVQARISLALGKRSDAYQAYTNALALEATNPEALLGVAQNGLGVGRLREAEAAADKILVLDPNQTDAMLVKGIIRMVRNDLDGAIAFSDRILALKQGDIGGLILKSRVLALQGENAAAQALISDSIAKVGDNRELTMSLAELQRNGGDPIAFTKLLRRIRRLVPDNRDYRFDLVDVLYRQGHIEEARAEMTALIAEPTLTPVEVNRFARLLYAYDRAALTPNQITMVSTKAAVDTRLALARFYIATQRPTTAIAILRPIATGWSSDVQALYARAIGVAGNLAAAGTAADGILDNDPDNGDALLIRADAAMARQDPAAAVIDYQRVIRDYPKWEEGYLGLARAYASAKKVAGVQRAFEDGRRALPQSLPLARAYIAALLGMGDVNRALDVARHFALNSPSLLAGWSLYGNICAKVEDATCRSEAVDGMNRARTRYGLDLAPGTPPPISLIGRLT